MAYSATSDMLIGDMSTSANTGTYVDGAADEIDARLGVTYVVPIDTDLLAPWAQKLLKKINNFLASGRFLEAQASGAEASAVNAYGASLIKEAIADLNQIANGSLLLEGAPIRAGQSAPAGPSIKNEDSSSATDAFAAFTSRWPRNPWPRLPYEPPIWQPGR